MTSAGGMLGRPEGRGLDSGAGEGATGALLRVLLVEDSADDAELLDAHLSRHGLRCEVVVVDDERAFEAALSSGRFDIVLSDFSLPRFSGRRALERLRASGLDIPFVLVSGAIGELHAVEMMRAGAADYLIKDDLARLVPVIQREVRDAADRRDRRRAEEALRRSEGERRREALLLGQTQVLAGVGGWEYDVATGALYWTEQVYKLFEVDPATFSPSPESFASLLAPEDRPRVAAMWRACMREASSFELEYRLRTGGGRDRWFRSIAHSVVEHGRVVRVVGANLDITERKSLEARLLFADRLSSMGALAAGVVHEINNPLGFVVGNLPLLLARLHRAAEEERGRGDEGRVAALVRELEPLVRDCQNGAERIRSIVGDLKVYSRDEARVDVPCDLGEVLASVLRMAATDIRHRANLVLEIAPVPPVRGSASRLAQVFTNLVVNALQALPSRPVDENRVSVRAFEAEGGVVAEVSDNGVGVSPEARARLFEPFFTTKPVGEGTGLGLYVCRTIVDALGGRIDVRSEGGRGTTFRVWLPLSDVPAPAEAPPVAQDLASEARPAARVLVVDDEANLLRVLVRSLPDDEVTTISSADELRRFWSAGARFDVILYDLMFRGWPGADFAAHVRATAPGQASRIVFMSGGAFTDEARRLLESLPDDQILEKPFTPPILTRAIGRLLARVGHLGS